ncbi:MAG: hybrid sensor histidine kinase/response regulator [Pseudomonadota bacterium]|nr:hybrid sensor histidine kinase/response regulator [Pseudomonadota bacterium]
MDPASDSALAPAPRVAGEIEGDSSGVDVRRLYGAMAPTATAGFVAALCLWLLIYLRSGSMAALLWALLIHAAQLGQLALLLAFRRGQSVPGCSRKWLGRYRLSLSVTALAWGLAPLLLLPADDPAAVGFVTFALFGIAVGTVAGIATDRASVYLWILPVTTPLPLVLAWRGGGNNLVLAALAITFVACILRLVLAQNRLLSETLRTQLENAALVQRLHRQMELTAQTSREKSQFLASASHDLRQPLHALSFFGATLERRMAGSTDQPLIYNMMRSIEALDKSFGAILDISKLDAGAVEPHVQSFPIRDLFRRLQMSFAGQAEEAGLQLRFRPGATVVTSDPQLLERILGNLVQNGLRYSRPGTGVLVAARRRRGGVSLEVWDAGVGIAEAEVPKIFAEFYQVANPERDRGKGLGMGLAIVKRLSDLLGHELTVRSKPGRGSVFRVWVARIHAEQMEEFAVGAETIPGALDDTRTVLLIDDEEAIRTSVGELLAEWGYEVVAVSTIAAGVAAAHKRNGAIDIVLSDLRLRHGEDGLRAIEQVRLAAGFDVPALLITGDTSPDQVLRVHASGHIILYKPVQPKLLLALLKKLA